ncbi:hypothetical protein ACWC1D_36855, partial [Streptomyces sp. NPDC001478]
MTTGRRQACRTSTTQHPSSTHWPPTGAAGSWRSLPRATSRPGAPHRRSGHTDAFAELTTRMGYWVDLDDAYRTMD